MENPTPLARNSFAWRFTVPFLMGENFWNAVMEMCGAILAVRHVAVGTRPHYHVAIANATLTQDTLRKKLREMVLNEYTKEIAIQRAKNVYNDDPSWEGLRDIPEGQSLMSLKKWDTSPTLLIYMLKGSLPESANKSSAIATWHTMGSWGYAAWLDQAYLKYIRDTWVSKNPQENWYRGWMVSEHFPKPTVMNENGEVIYKNTFDTIIKHARTYVQVTEGTDYVNAKQRYVIKDLISNYCQRHGIKMAPVYI